MYLEDEDALPPIVDPAPLGARTGAGAIDTVAIGPLSLLFLFLTTPPASGSPGTMKAGPSLEPGSNRKSSSYFVVY